MKTVTRYLVKFALSAIVLTVLFRYFLSYGIENKANITILLSAAIYGTAMFVAGWYFGKKDGEYLPIFDVGFRFHLTTYLVHNVISLLWIGLGFGANLETMGIALMVAFYWGIFLIVHLVFFLRVRKYSIDNLDKNDLFE